MEKNPDLVVGTYTSDMLPEVQEQTIYHLTDNAYSHKQNVFSPFPFGYNLQNIFELVYSVTPRICTPPRGPSST